MSKEREYVIVCNEHKGLFAGCLLFWGERTADGEKRSFGGYTSNLDACERYTLEEVQEYCPYIPVVQEDEKVLLSFIDCEDVAVKASVLTNSRRLKTATVIYRP